MPRPATPRRDHHRNEVRTKVNDRIFKAIKEEAREEGTTLAHIVRRALIAKYPAKPQRRNAR